ncbi:glycoside/pentoside/hexuronide:cation symporter, GPH family [Evansella caseinilytica]|uniref:Glycoside/pentoside/hexuronide:cation symporter, GPH family n=1 Tax=Evansella caseinilytica TaxID=1503961 RepID=A0A1H3HH72_9BACI|nr:MFS transporter [Evansella caseinilytica]SDY14817.1 glycoside/pentoside/hexuronide:cation symporter, GPH family [Evansella caseinilytica]
MSIQGNIEGMGEQSQTESNQQLKMREKFTYGFGNLGANLLITTANTFIIYFYTEVVGIAVATVGTLLLVARIFDGITDVGMGIIVDKTKSKHGKSRPWLLWMAVPYGLAIIMLFSSPEFGDTGKVIYAFITYVFALSIVYTATTVPYNAMIGTLSQHQKDRGHLSIFRTAFGFTGALAVSMMTLPIVSFFGDGKKGWMITAVIYGVVASLLFILVFKSTKERVMPVASAIAGQKQKMPLTQSLKTLVKNKYWLIVIVVMLVTFINSGLSGVNVYYAQYILGNPNLVGAMGFAQFLPIIGMMLFMGPIMKRFSNRDVCIGGMIISILSSFVIMIDPANMTIVMIGLALRGIGGAPLLVAGYAMLADTVEYGEWKTGIRNEGMTFSAATFGEKVGTGIGGMLLGTLMGLGGYVGGQAVQSATALSSIKAVFIYVPIVAGVIAVILLTFYKLDKIYPQIIAELQQQKSN